jgi:hypothetical protein
VGIGPFLKDIQAIRRLARLLNREPGVLGAIRVSRAPDRTLLKPRYPITATITAPTPVASNQRRATPSAASVSKNRPAPMTQEKTDSAPDHARWEALRESLLRTYRENSSSIDYARNRINEIAQYDFNEFRFLASPEFVPAAYGGSAPLSEFLDKAEAIIISVVEAAPPMITRFHDMTMDNSFFEEFHYTPDRFHGRFSNGVRSDGETVDVAAANNLVAVCFQRFLEHLAAPLFEIENRILSPENASTLAAFGEWFQRLYDENPFSENTVVNSIDNPDLWSPGLEQVLAILEGQHPDIELGDLRYSEGNGYDFRPFSSRSVAFGIRLGYRQCWRPLGAQAGETVKTIPLGPKQSERVTTKTSTSRKQSSYKEVIDSQESTSEVSGTAKTSAEIIADSTATVSTELSAKVSIPIKLASAEVGSTLGTELSSASKETKSSLNERMERTTQRMRNDVKVSVSNEFQSTMDYERSTEISNPNDDIAITYLYSRLQQQYELTTRLNQVENVVFVPERLPSRHELTESWIVRHDWVIAKNLLDESFRKDLNIVMLDFDAGIDWDVELDRDHFKSVSTTSKDAQDKYTKFKGGDINDIFHGQNELYLRQLDKIKAEKEMTRRARTSLRRLRQHIGDNILHYMRAIWRAEDPDQRSLRYNERMVPIRWTFVPDEDPVDTAAGTGSVGRFIPEYSTGSLRPLSSIIDATVPLGFTGNCAIYGLKLNPELIGLHEGLMMLKAYYIKYSTELANASADLPEVVHIGAVYSAFERARYAFRWDSATSAWTARDADRGIDLVVKRHGTRTLYSDGLVVVLGAEPSLDCSFEVIVRSTPTLQDPEEKVLPLAHPLPAVADEPAFWTPELLEDMQRTCPTLTLASNDLDDLDADAVAELRRAYYSYCYIKDNTRALLVDTNDLMLDILVSDDVVLEDFKRAHRMVDVLKEMEEAERRRLENDRRRARIDAGVLDDPDVDNLHQINLTA